MERTDSSSAMLLLQYGEDSDEDTSLAEQTEQTETVASRDNSQSASADPASRQISDDSFTKEPTGFISDDEGDHNRDLSESGGQMVSPGTATLPLQPPVSKMAPESLNISSQDENSSSSYPDLQNRAKKPSKLATRLVSYGPDDVDEDEEEDDASEESEASGDDKEEPVNPASPVSAGAASPGPRGLAGIDSNNIQLPSEPPGKCSKELQDKIADYYMKMKQFGFDPNREIQRLTSFRNPSIYEKLIQQFKIDEKGSNFPLDIYNPHMWGKESFYDELDKAQKKDMERREKERKEKTKGQAEKAKIEFISGTKKTTLSDSSGGPDEKKRKSKWDVSQPGAVVQPRPLAGTVVGMAGVANLTTSVTGTKATVISAVGTLKKK